MQIEGQDPNNMSEAELERATSPEGAGQGAEPKDKPEPEKLAASTASGEPAPNVVTQPQQVQHQGGGQQHRHQGGGQGPRKHQHHQGGQREVTPAQGAPSVPEKIGSIKGLENVQVGHGQPARQASTPAPRPAPAPAPAIVAPVVDNTLELEKVKLEQMKLRGKYLDEAGRIFNLDRPLGKQYLEYVFRNF